MRVEDILRTKGTRIGTVRVNETVETALRLLRTEQTDGLVVKDVCRTEGNTVVGVLSEHEVVKGLTERGAAVLAQPVTAVMRRDPVFCRPGDPVHHVLRIMDEHAVRHVPVLDGATLIGVISVRDLIHVQVARAQVAGADADESWEFPVAAHQ